jgi:hypothetical protein
VSGSLIPSLRRWADAREKRNTRGGHGATGTALLREAADEIEQLAEALREIRMLTVEVGDSVEAATRACDIAMKALGE